MKFRKKPVEVEAIQFTKESKDQVFNFVTCNRYPLFEDDGITPVLKIQTLEGEMFVRVGDWVIKGVAGEFYPCKPDIFKMTYDASDVEIFNLTLGDMVMIDKDAPMGGGERGYVYETYPDFDQKHELGVQVITESGNDLGGWSKKEQLMWFKPLGHSGWDYQFTNVMKLDSDFRSGVFDRVFKK